MNAIRTFNVEAGLTTLDEARRLVAAEIKTAKLEEAKVLKVIHGYGSSGKGGALCVGLMKSFGLRKKEGVIKDFIAGEDFSIFNEPVLALLEAVTDLLEQVVRPLLGPWRVWQLAAISALAGLFEELLFRGVIQAGLTRHVGPVLAIIAASLLFGLLHPLTWAYLLLATAIGAYLGGLYCWSGNLLVPIVAHAVYDFAALVFFLRYHPEP